MIRKYELSLSPDYVPTWGVLEAARELFQNVLDQETICKDNPMFWKYIKSEEKLILGNKASVLPIESLLLGTSTKADDPNTIGRHGEGYKVATLVLLRLGKKITFYNYGNKEVWTTKLVKSRKYKGTQILTFLIDNMYPWNKIPDNNLTIEVEGITAQEFELIEKANLHMQDVNGEVLEVSQGRILLGNQYAHQIYVNGLFVTKDTSVQYGYDLLPKYVTLDRDRRMIRTFDLQWLTSKMWNESQDTRAIELAKQNRGDVRYIGDQATFNKLSVKQSDAAAKVFTQEYGEKAMPVTNQIELEVVTKNYPTAKPIIVSDTYKTMIESSSEYKKPEKVIVTPLKIRIEQWLTSIQHLIPGNKYVELTNLLKELPQGTKEIPNDIAEDLPF